MGFGKQRLRMKVSTPVKPVKKVKKKVKVKSEKVEKAVKDVKAIYDNQKRLKGNHPALSLFPVGEAQKGIEGLKLHEGAEEYFATR